MRADGLHADVKAPSELTDAERAAWAALMKSAPHLQRAFLSPGFAIACELAGNLARVAVIRDRNGSVCAFLPFQFAGRRQRLMRAAERVGGGLADHCGLIARPGFRIDPRRLVGLAGLGALFLDQISDGQAEMGLAATELHPGHVIEIPDGAAAYFARLAATNKGFLQDTERRLRRFEKELGTPEFTLTVHPDWPAVQSLIEAKRAQYARTGVGDSFARPGRLPLVQALVEGRHPDCTPILTQLSAGGRIIARHLGLLHAGNLSYWFPVYDREAQKVSPGRMLLWHTLKAADAHGIRLIDRGGGDSQAKRDFSTGLRQFGRLNLVAPGWRGLVARCWQSLAWRLRK